MNWSPLSLKFMPSGQTHATGGVFRHLPYRYRSEAGLLHRLQQASSLAELRTLLKELRDSGQLGTLAARYAGTASPRARGAEGGEAARGELRAWRSAPGAAAGAAAPSEEEPEGAAAAAAAAKGGTREANAAPGLGPGRQLGASLIHNSSARLPLEGKGRLNASLPAKQVFLLCCASHGQAQLASDLAQLWRYRLCGHVKANAWSTARLKSCQAVLARWDGWLENMHSSMVLVDP